MDHPAHGRRHQLQLWSAPDGQPQADPIKPIKSGVKMVMAWAMDMLTFTTQAMEPTPLLVDNLPTVGVAGVCRRTIVHSQSSLTAKVPSIGI